MYVFLYNTIKWPYQSKHSASLLCELMIQLISMPLSQSIQGKQDSLLQRIDCLDREREGLREETGELAEERERLEEALGRAEGERDRMKEQLLEEQVSCTNTTLFQLPLNFFTNKTW